MPRTGHLGVVEIAFRQWTTDVCAGVVDGVKDSVDIEKGYLFVAHFDALRPTGSDLICLCYFDKFSHCFSPDFCLCRQCLRNEPQPLGLYPSQALETVFFCFLLSPFSKLAQEPAHGIIVLVHDTFFQWNDRVPFHVRKAACMSVVAGHSPRAAMSRSSPPCYGTFHKR